MQILSSEKYSVVERMDGCDYSFEIIIVITVPLKEHITETIFFVVVEANVLIAERTAQTMDDCKISRQTKYIILERMDDCYSFCNKNRYQKQQLADVLQNRCS